MLWCVYGFDTCYYNKCSEDRYYNDYYEDTTIFDSVEVDTAYSDNYFEENLDDV